MFVLSVLKSPQLLTLIDADTFQGASCDEDKLKQLFGVSNETTLHQMQRELCNLTSADFASIARVVTEQIDMDKLLTSVRKAPRPH